MKEYEVLAASVTLHTGNVKLTEKQAATRDYALRAVPKKKGVYEIMRPVQFKHGEVFGFDGDVPKALMNVIGAPKEAEPAKEPEQEPKE